MDIKRPPKSKIKKRIRTGLLIVIGVVAIGGITYGLSKLKPAAPTIDRSTTVIDTVKRGQMLRQVRGSGTLVAKDVRLILAPADGRVETCRAKSSAWWQTANTQLWMASPSRWPIGHIP